MDKCSNRSEELNKSNKSSKTIILNENRSSDDDKYSLQSIVCRICFDDNKDEPIITPCHCKVNTNIDFFTSLNRIEIIIIIMISLNI